MEDGQQVNALTQWFVNNATQISLGVSIVGTLATFIGLFFTIRVFRSVKRLTSQYGLKRFAPERIESLRSFHNAVEESLNGSGERAKSDALLNLSNAQVTISDLSSQFEKVNKKRYRESIQPLSRSYSRYVHQCVISSNKANLRSASRSLSNVIEACQYFFENEDWSVSV